MSLLSSLKRKLAGSAFLAFLLFSFGVTPLAHAQFAVFDNANTLQTTLSALANAALEEKELVLDGLFYDIANQALQQMTSDIIDWANSGFNGEPAFVTDLLGFLKDIADEVAADFIYGDSLSSLCTPFKLDVVTAIAEEYEEEQHGSTKEKLQCSINDIAGGNPEAFLNGDFSAGGWSMWFEIALHPENSPIGAKVAGKAELAKEIASQQYAGQKDVDYGRGFKSQEACSVVDGKRKCTVTTPGALIQEQVSLAIQAPMLRMIGADEMNEIIGALFSNLANQAFQGVNGLLGLSQSSSNGSSYLDEVRTETNGTASNGGGSGSRIEQALRTETQVLELQLAVISELDEISNAFIDAQEPYENDSCWNLDLPEAFTDKLDELVAEVPTTVNTVVELEEMLENSQDSESSQGQLQTLQQLSRMQSEGKLSGRTAVIELQNYLQNDLRPKIKEFEEALQDEEDSC